MDIDRPNLEVDMKNDSIVISYLKDEDVAKQFYAALCNMQWKKISVIPEDERIIEKLKGADDYLWHCSWRYAGGIISDIRNDNYNTSEDYMSFYCSGNEGDVTDLVEECLKRMGWVSVPYDD